MLLRSHHHQQAAEDQPEVGFAVELILEAGAESSGPDRIATRTVSFMMAAMAYGAAMLM
jgi:hypothetical protein